MPKWIGYRWLIDYHKLAVTQPLHVETAAGPTRTIVTLSRLSPVVSQSEIEAWIRDEPTGQYARRTGAGRYPGGWQTAWVGARAHP